MLSTCTTPVLYNALADPSRTPHYSAISLNAAQRGPLSADLDDVPPNALPCPRRSLAAPTFTLTISRAPSPSFPKMIQPALPQELIDAIIDEMGDSFKGKTRTAALAAVALTNYCFTRRAQLHQFHRLRLRNEAKCAQWAERFAMRPNIGTHVRDIDLVGQGASGELDLSCWPALPDVLRACTGMNYLGIWRANVNKLPDLPSFHELVPSLRRLMFRDCFASFEVLEKLLTTFPMLQELKLGAMDMTGIHAPAAELPPLRLRRLTLLHGLTLGGGGHAYGARLGRSIGMLDELKMPFDYSEHFDFVRDLIKSLDEGPVTLRLTHSNRDCPPTQSDISKMNLHFVKHLAHLQIGRIDLSGPESTHWDKHFIAELEAGTLEHVFLEYIADSVADVRKKPWNELDASLGRARHPLLQSTRIVLHCAPGVDRHACIKEVEASLPLLRARDIALSVE